MNKYIQSIELLNEWWKSLNEEWRCYLYLEYLRKNKIRLFYDLCYEVINGQEYFLECVDEAIFPDVIHYSLRAKELTRFDLSYRNRHGYGLTFELHTAEPIKDMVFLKELTITGCIKDFKAEYLKALNDLEQLTIYYTHSDTLTDILLLNLPSLKKISIESDGYDGLGSTRLNSIASKTRIELEEYVVEGDTCFFIDQEAKKHRDEEEFDN